jgi:hypothetical protein
MYPHPPRQRVLHIYPPPLGSLSGNFLRVFGCEKAHRVGRAEDLGDGSV